MSNPRIVTAALVGWLLSRTDSSSLKMVYFEHQNCPQLQQGTLKKSLGLLISQPPFLFSSITLLVKIVA